MPKPKQGRPVLDEGQGGVRLNEHRAFHARRTDWVMAGRCYDCGQPSDGGWRCIGCRAKVNARIRKRAHKTQAQEIQTPMTAKKPDGPTNENEIGSYMHCGLCLDEWKSGATDDSPAEFARLNVGWTKRGLQVWCHRHQVNVLNIDFEGHRHPADTTRKTDH